MLMENREIIEKFTPLIAPRTVAVVGASTKGMALPNVFIRRIREFGYDGARSEERRVGKECRL